MIGLAFLAFLVGPPEPPINPDSDAATSGGVLTLAEVLESVENHDPRLRAADHQIEGAEGGKLTARGGFDTKILFQQYFEPLYKTGITRVMVEQATPLYGLSVWAMYQVGVNAYPHITQSVFEPGTASRHLSATGGELFIGATLPLVRNGLTDRRRTDIKQSKLERERVGHVRDMTQLQLEFEAATAYWNWVAAGLEMAIAEQLLDLAATRQTKLLRQIELGSVDRLAGVDNARLVLDREARVVTAERAFQNAALDLSLFMRDDRGNPMTVGAERLPDDMPPMAAPTAIDLQADIATAIEQRPDRKAALLGRDQSDIELRWARNQRTPRVDLSFWASQELGDTYFQDAGEIAYAQGTELVTWLTVEIPIPMRASRGQVKTAEASLDIVKQDLRLLDNQIARDVADAHSAFVAAYQRAVLAGEQVGLTRELATAEMKRFELGEGDLLLVNLRELAITEAQQAEIRSIADYFIAKAGLEVAKGAGVQPVEP